jgi:elongation factor P
MKVWLLKKRFMRANELKRGDLVEFDGQSCLVKKIDTRSPSARGASTLYKIRLDNLVTGQKKEINVKGDFHLSELNSEKVKVQFSYQDSGQYFFMNLTDFNQYVADEGMLAGKLQYLSEGLEDILAVFVEGRFLGIELPHSIVLRIDETSPSIKGASASARTKPAKFSTGLVVQVPEYIGVGEKIKINTATGEYISRA